MGLLLALSFFAALPAQAQRAKARHKYFDNLVWKQNYYRGPLKVGLSFGRSIYFGDLSEGIRGNRGHWSAGTGASYTVWPNLDAAVEAQYLRLEGVDQLIDRGYHFRTSLIELTVVGRYYIEKYHFDPALDSREQMRQPRFRYFALLGVGGAQWWAKTYGGPEAATPGAPNFNGERTYPARTLVVPVGGGVSIRLSPLLWVLPEFSYRFTFTDDLDDVGKRRGGGRNDGYAQFAVRFQYALPPPEGKHLHGK